MDGRDRDIKESTDCLGQIMAYAASNQLEG